MTTPSALGNTLAPIVTEVFGTMVNYPATPAPAAEIIGSRVTAFIGIGNGKKYTVLLECGEALACKAAGAMLMDTYAEWSDGVQDALAEITNMIAGNVKSKLPEPQGLSLSLPTVVRGSNYECRTPHMKILEEAGFDCAGSPMTLRIVEEE